MKESKTEAEDDRREKAERRVIPRPSIHCLPCCPHCHLQSSLSPPPTYLVSSSPSSPSSPMNSFITEPSLSSVTLTLNFPPPSSSPFCHHQLLHHQLNQSVETPKAQPSPSLFLRSSPPSPLIHLHVATGVSPPPPESSHSVVTSQQPKVAAVRSYLLRCTKSRTNHHCRLQTPPVTTTVASPVTNLRRRRVLQHHRHRTRVSGELQRLRCMQPNTSAPPSAFVAIGALSPAGTRTVILPFPSDAQPSQPPVSTISSNPSLSSVALSSLFVPLFRFRLHHRHPLLRSPTSITPELLRSSPLSLL